MEVCIKGTPKEIAALVVELQERQGAGVDGDVADKIILRLQEQQGRDLQEFAL